MERLDLPRSPILMDSERVRDSVMKSILSVILQWPPTSTSQTWMDELPFIVVWGNSTMTTAFGFFSWRYFCHWLFNLILFGDKFLSLFKVMTKTCYGILWQFSSWSWTCVSPSKAQDLQRAPESSRKQQNGSTTSCVMLLFLNIKKRNSSLISYHFFFIRIISSISSSQRDLYTDV